MSSVPAGALPRLRALRTVFRAALAALLHTFTVQRATHNVVTHTRKIFHAAATNQHDRVLLQVVTLTRNVRRHFILIGQAYTRNLSQSRVRLLGRHSANLGANAPLLGGTSHPEGPVLQGIVRELKCRRFALTDLLATPLADQLINCRQWCLFQPASWSLGQDALGLAKHP